MGTAGPSTGCSSRGWSRPGLVAMSRACEAQSANSRVRKAATLSQSFAAASKSTSIAWTVRASRPAPASSVVLSSGIWALGPSARAASTSGLSRWSARASAASAWGAPLMIASVLGMNSVPSSSGLAVGVDDRDRAAGLDLAHRVVGVGQAEGDLARADGRGDLLVAREDLHAVGLQVAEEARWPSRRPRRRTGRRRAWPSCRRAAWRCRSSPSTSGRAGRRSPWAGRPRRRAWC